MIFLVTLTNETGMPYGSLDLLLLKLLVLAATS